MNDGYGSAEKDLEVQPEGPVLDVEVVEPGALVDRGVAPQAVDLGPAGQAAGHSVAGVVAAVESPNSSTKCGRSGRVRPGSCRHADVEQLGQLVQRGDAQEPADRPEAVVVGDVPFGLRLLLVAGRSERNFSSWKCTPSRPTRSWRNRTPGPPSRRTAMAQQRSSGDSTSRATAEKTTSTTRLNCQLNVRYADRRSRIRGRSPRKSPPAAPGSPRADAATRRPRSGASDTPAPE